MPAGRTFEVHAEGGGLGGREAEVSVDMARACRAAGPPVRARLLRGEYGEYLLVGYRREVPVRLADRAERGRRPEADDVVHPATQGPAGLEGADGDGDDDRRRAQTPDAGDGGAHGGAGGEPVVDDDRRPARDGDRWATGAVGALAPAELGELGV